MSAKGYSPGNAAAEGFFGRLEYGFHRKRNFTGMSIDEPMAALDDYIVWYRDTRIRTQYDMSITNKRRKLGLMT